MKRDMDIIRRIAIETAELPYRNALSGLDDVALEDFVQHVIWMQEAGLIKARVSEFIDDTPSIALVLRLTWEGCEFADAVKSDTLWNSAKESVIKPASSFTFGLLKDWLKAEMQQGFPTLRTMS
ncbi:DUF2513 domain-containing protein [Collimonas humicola]|uniref:DUF2513 domain-containing protein n=1 Tax=Collimonas humicola TaxID=2825886 RepID=UPI001B8A938B|nr:DUF2513 domain-containing protein [Collimonas humicola]